jgi:hypothetical protein
MPAVVTIDTKASGNRLTEDDLALDTRKELDQSVEQQSCSRQASKQAYQVQRELQQEPHLLASPGHCIGSAFAHDVHNVNRTIGTIGDNNGTVGSLGFDILRAR